MDSENAELKKVLNNLRTKTVAGPTMVLDDALDMPEGANERIKALECTISNVAKDVEGNKKTIQEVLQEDTRATNDFDKFFTKARPTPLA